MMQTGKLAPHAYSLSDSAICGQKTQILHPFPHTERGWHQQATATYERGDDMTRFKQVCVFLCVLCSILFAGCSAAAPGAASQSPATSAPSGPASEAGASSHMEKIQEIQVIGQTLDALIALRDETYGDTFAYNMHVGLEHEGTCYEVSGADIPFQSLAGVQAIYPTMQLPETVNGQALTQVEISASDNALARECQKGSIPQQPFTVEVLPENIESLAATYGTGEKTLTLVFWNQAASQLSGWEPLEALENGCTLVRYGSSGPLALQWEGMGGTFHLSGEESALRTAAQAGSCTAAAW